jgi:hypothetical protein
MFAPRSRQCSYVRCVQCLCTNNDDIFPLFDLFISWWAVPPDTAQFNINNKMSAVYVVARTSDSPIFSLSLSHTRIHTHIHIECVCYLLHCVSIVNEKTLLNRLFAICIIRAYTYLYIIYYDFDDNKNKLSSSSVVYSSWSRSHRKRFKYNTILNIFAIAVRNESSYVLCLICDIDVILF